jgi:Ca-activated chloride channel homolog
MIRSSRLVYENAARFMKASRALRYLALFLGVATLGAQQPSFRVDVRLVRLLVTVKNAAGDLVGLLNRSDFTVQDDGVAQDIAVFEHQTAQPLSVAVLIDTSASTGKDLRYETASITKFLNALVQEGNPDDSVSLYTFNWQVTLLNSFTRRISRIEENLKTLHPEGGTSLYDAVYLCSQQLHDRDGRHVIVVVSDGGDTTSSKKYRDALDAAQNADAVFYPVVVIPITNDAGRNTGGEHALETLAGSTGGRAFYPSVGDSLDRAFEEILRDLRTQYLIGYYPRGVIAGDTHFHAVRVELPKRRDLRVSTRTGYYGEVSR